MTGTQAPLIRSEVGNQSCKYMHTVSLTALKSVAFLLETLCIAVHHPYTAVALP